MDVFGRHNFLNPHTEQMLAVGILCFCIQALHLLHSYKRILETGFCVIVNKTSFLLVAFSKAFQTRGNYSPSVSLHHSATVMFARVTGGRKYNAIIKPLTMTEAVRSQVLLLNPDTALYL